MGWWPFSASDDTSNGASGVSAPSKRDFSLTEEQRTRIFGVSGATNKSSGGQQEDPELDAFLKEMGAEVTPKPAATKPVSPAPYPAIGGMAPSLPAPVMAEPQVLAPPPPTHDENGRRVNPDGSLDISPDALYPRTMSCRQAFDQAFYCQSVGGKFNDIYRYGSLQPCSEQWGAFWFCMRTRTYAEKVKEELISDYYKRREERKKKQYGSSEDIWEIRTKGVERAFGRDPDADDAESLVRS